MKTKRQLRRQINRRRLGDLISTYNELYSDGKINHVEMAENVLGVNVSTFLRWRTFKAVPSKKVLDNLEMKLEKMKG